MYISMSKKNWAKGIKISELNAERQEKAEELNEFLKEKSNNRKTGKAETGRLALDLAHDRLQELESEKERKKEDLAQYMRKVDEIVERLK